MVDWSPEARLKAATGNGMVIPLNEAVAFYDAIEAVFVDARPPDIYAEGHIPGAVLWSNGLLWAFFLALLFNHYRGLDVHCGCFSTRPDPASPPPTAWYLFRDPIFLLTAGYLMFQQFMIPKSVQSPTRQLEGAQAEQLKD